MLSNILLKQNQLKFKYISTLYATGLPLLKNRGITIKKNGKWNVMYVSLSFILPFSLPAYVSQKRRCYHKNIPMGANISYGFV